LPRLLFLLLTDCTILEVCTEVLASAELRPYFYFEEPIVGHNYIGDGQIPETYSITTMKLIL
jgi:hypothetical protein